MGPRWDKLLPLIRWECLEIARLIWGRRHGGRGVAVTTDGGNTAHGHQTPIGLRCEPHIPEGIYLSYEHRTGRANGDKKLTNIIVNTKSLA